MIAPAHAQADLSQASGVSMLPVAVSVAAPVTLLTAGATLTLVSVEAGAQSTVWVLERASDGARISLRFAAGAVEAVLRLRRGRQRKNGKQPKNRRQRIP